jgi:hypothetical protein
MFPPTIRRTVTGMDNLTHAAGSQGRSAEVAVPGRDGASTRAGALAGLVGAALYLVGALLPGTPPKPDASAAQVVAFFGDRRGDILTGVALELIAGGLFLYFVGQLRSTLAARGGTAVALSTTMTAAWVVLMTTVIAGTLPALALVWQGVPASDPLVARLAYDMEIMGTYAAGAVAAFVSIGAPSVVIWRTGVLPRWLALLGVAEMLANVVELSGLAVRHGALAAGDADGIGALFWVVWVAAASICMVRPPRSAERSDRVLVPAT